MDKNTTCFFTGHRDIPQKRYAPIYDAVSDKLAQLYADGYRNFICGGAVGFDTLAAEAVIALRQTHNNVKLLLCIPCRDQSKYFSSEQKSDYERIMSQCDGYEILYDRYVRGCMHTRNRRMADASSYCVAYCIKESGGSAYTVKYAQSHGIDVYFVK